MASAGLEKLIVKVEERTGYKVNVTSDTGMSVDARMRLASRDNPHHIIFVNSERAEFGDYITAIQCAMILLLWSDPDNIPRFAHKNDKVEYLIDKTAKSPPFKKLNPKLSYTAAKMNVEGLLNQMQSMPAEMGAVKMCRELCPDLVEMQAISVTRTMRTNSKVLTPQCRDMSPPGIYEKSVAMNAAFAVNWDRLTGGTVAALPYRGLTSFQLAEKLIKAYDYFAEEEKGGHVKTVDAWADTLQLKHLYTWEFRKG